MLPLIEVTPRASLSITVLTLAPWMLSSCLPQASGEVRSTVRVERGPIEESVVASGTIEPQHEVPVRSRIAGVVEAVNVDENDEVEPGQVLVEIETDVLEADIDSAMARYQAAEVEARWAQSRLERVESLWERNVASQSALDEARAAAERAEAAVHVNQSAVDALRVQLKHARIRSPIGGRVLSVKVTPGTAVTPVTSVTGGTLLLLIAATERLHISALIDENDVARLAPGQRALVRTEAFGDRVFEGELTEISPVGERHDNVGYFGVEVVITDPDAGLLKPKMSADAEILVRSVEDAVLLPQSAIRYDGDSVYVDVVTGNGHPTVESRSVRVGIVTASHVQVLEGLFGGEEVLVE